ncbi:tRNA 2'-phosphotransferase 1 [Entomortierella beljakovae]|nr:tRNA 2'-phosphotransferase 1 [Entomortierella beljakovae]
MASRGSTSSSSRGRGNRNRGPRVDSPDVQLSKSLSWLLRHNAEKQGIEIRPDGYVKISDILGHSRFRQFTLVDINRVVSTNDKQRFQLLVETTGQTYIRAVQGHSLTNVDDLGYEDITDSSQLPCALHGTLQSKWDLIQMNGLSKMTRNHIHMATGLPGDNEVISGMRKGCNLYIYVDVSKALADGIKFYRTSNNVILSDGKNGDGVIPAEYFMSVVTSSGKTIYPIQ